MFKARQKRVSVLVACLTALCAVFFAFVGIFSVSTTTASAAETQAYSYTFTSKQFTANGSKTLGGVTWTLAGDGGYWGNDGTKGQQFGSGSKPYKTLTLTSSTTFNNVSKIEINTSGANDINASLTVKVGGTQVGNTTKITSAAKAYTFSSSTPLTGEVVLSYTQTSSKAIYIKSIAIYESAVQCNHDYEWVQENGQHREVCSLCEEVKEGTSWVACAGDLDYTILEAGANGTHKKVGVCSTCGANLSTDAEPCVFEYSISGTTKTYTCECGNSYTEEITLRTISFSYPSNVTLNGDATISSADGEVVTLPTTSNPDGYIFLGWATASIVGSTESKPTTYKSWTVNGDATLYAVYQKDVQPGGWNLVTDVNDLATGDIVTIVAPTSKVAIGSKSNTSTVYFTTIGITSADSVLMSSNALTKLTVTKNASKDGQFAFKTGTNYLSWSSGNSLTTSSSEYYWTVGIGAQAKTTTSIASVNDPSRKLQYNAGSPRFACYTTSQTAVALYEYSEGEPISYVTTFCEHDGDTTTNTVPPTCTQKGSETTTCDLCGVQLSYTELNATNHANQTTTTQPATCTEAGATIVTCDDCGITLSSTPIPETGHAWDEGTVSVEPQVGIEGELLFTCENGCGETYTESIPALNATMYTVEYVVPNDVANVPSEEIAKGFNVVLPSAEALVGYTFVGWTTEAYSVNTAAPTTVYKIGDNYEVNEDTTFFALYSYLLGSNDYTKVTDATKLAVGKEIVIVANSDNVALSTEDRGNNRGAIAITKSNDTIAINEDVQIITLESGLVANTFAFNVGGAYLYAASSSSNQLKTKTELDNNGSWSITISNGVATIKANGSNTRNLLKFNSTNNPKIFSCYANGQNEVAIYMKESTIYYTTDTLANINGSTITVGADLKLNYKVSLPDAFADAKMHFTFDNETYDVAGVKQADGRYAYSLAIPPQAMAVNVKAELKFGDILLDSMDNYSIQTYAQNKLNATDSSDELKQLVTDMLYYGAAAQTYKNYNLENLATVGVENLGAPSTAEPEEPEFTATPINNKEVESYPVYFTKATVWFGDVNKIYIQVNAIEGATLSINGEAVALTSHTIETVLLATEFDEEFTFALYYEGVLMQTLTYSVNAYAYKMKDHATMGALAKALYNYGKSAEAYIN